METKADSKVEVVGDEVVITHVNVIRMDFVEACKELKNVQSELFRLNKLVAEGEKAMLEKTAEKQLAEVKSRSDRVSKLRRDWEEVLEPHLEKVKGKLVDEVRRLLPKSKVKRMKDDAKKIEVNRLVAEAALTLDLDMADRVVQDVKRDFDALFF